MANGTLNHLFAQVECAEAGELLRHWAWLTEGRSLRPVALTIFGDWFLEDRDSGAISFLDAGFGTLEEIAPSREAWRAAGKDPENQQRWFLAGQYDLLRDVGAPHPGAGLCFSWLIPPAAGGSLEISNFEICSLASHQVAHARVTRHLRQLPEGTEVTLEMLQAMSEGDDADGTELPLGLIGGAIAALILAVRFLL